MISSPDDTLLPRLGLRIGVTGHRPNRLDAEAQLRVAESGREVLRALSVGVSSIKLDHSAVLSSDGPDLRLVTALAEGADTILASAARDAAMRLDVILPFRRDTYLEVQRMEPDARVTFNELIEVARCVLELDNDPLVAEAEGYLKAGRLLLAHSDVLVAVWDGAPAAGIGGTAQIAREAIALGTPVVWIRPDGAVCLVTETAQLEAFEDGVQLKLDGTSCPAVLCEVVRALTAPPVQDSVARDRLEQFQRTPTPSSSNWCIYDLLRYVALGRKFRMRVDYGVDAETETAWTRHRNCAQVIGGPSFAQAMADVLEPRWRHADALALHCSHAYRSTYVANFGLAAIAVVIGLVSVFWWNHASSISIKAGFVLAEVLLIGVILWLTRHGSEGRRDWHARWLESRSVAELLRQTRLPILIGETASPPKRPGFYEAPDAWVEWYVRATLREIGPPTGVLDAIALRAALESAVEDEIKGQISYNNSAVRSTFALDHWLHIWGERLFLATFFVGVAYLIFAVLASAGLIYVSDGWKQAVKALTTFVGGGFPAMGAALFGIRAIGDFKVAGEQARRTLSELDALGRRLEVHEGDLSREQASFFLTSLTQILSSDIRDWAKIYRLRELTLPG